MRTAHTSATCSDGFPFIFDALVRSATGDMRGLHIRHIRIVMAYRAAPNQTARWSCSIVQRTPGPSAAHRCTAIKLLPMVQGRSMDTTSPFMGDGLGGRVPLWTPDIKEVTTAYAAPLGSGRPGFRRPKRVRQVAAGFTVIAALVIPATTLPMAMSAAAAGASSHVTTVAGPHDTWT
jgi:hypothetical protein